MSQLQYKTPNMCEPKGLPRVYFCAHPDDAALRKEIAELVFEQKRCAIWYVDSEVENKEQHSMYLSQMQLFVMPVTFRILTTENFAFNYEYSYAVEHHIPIMPLMLEEGLEELFRKKCGNIPFVPYHRDGVKAGTFKENVKQFLDTVVVGDNLVERIREDFSAYIFLGYGKNDWQDAHRVMCMIQENEAARDVGIWCDELFVTEDRIAYDINAAMRKSKLFVMSVTPDLLEKKNVVTGEGYRMAVQEKVPVLAMEISPVSSFKFKWKYKKVASYAKSPEEFATALRNQLVSAGAQGKKASPEHDYLVGLAYLAGVDAVVDHKRAAELITRGAEAGYPEAMERLAVMYGYGMGVKQDVETAIRWQERYCDAAQSSAHNAVRALQQCGELYMLAGNSAGAEQKLIAAVEYLESCSAMEEKEKTTLFIAVYKKLAENAGSCRNSQALEEYCHKTVVYMERSCRERNTIEKVRACAFAFEDLGDACRQNKNFEDAKQYYDKAMGIYNPQLQETRDNLWRHRIAVIYMKQGDVATAQSLSEEAKEHYEKAKEALWNLQMCYCRTPQVYLDYAFCKLRLAGACMEVRETETAYQHCLKAGGEFKRLWEEQGSILARYYQAICVSKAGDIDMQREDSWAEMHRTEAVQWLMQLFSEYGLSGMQGRLLEEVIKYGEYCIKQGAAGISRLDEKKILKVFDEFLALEEKLRPDSREQEELLLACYETMGRVARFIKDERRTELFSQKATSYKENVFGESFGVEDKVTMARDLESLGDSEAEQDLEESAQSYYKQALAIWEEVKEACLSEALSARGRINIKLGDFVKWSDDDMASKYYVDAVNALQRLVKEFATKEAKRQLAACYESVCYMDRRLYLQKALDLRDELVNKYGEPEDYDALADCYVRMGRTYTERVESEKCIAYYEKALQVREKLLTLRGSLKNHYKLAHLYLDAILECVKHENRQTYLDKAQAIAEEVPVEGDYYRQQYEKGEFLCHFARAAYAVHNDIDLVANYTEQARTIFRELVEKYPCKESVRALRDAHFQFGKYRELVVTSAKEASVRGALNVVEAWVKKNYGGRKELEFLAGSYAAASHITRSETWLEMSNEIYRELANKYPKIKKYREMLELQELCD